LANSAYKKTGEKNNREERFVFFALLRVLCDKKISFYPAISIYEELVELFKNLSF
jgi:hypothetical protein